MQYYTNSTLVKMSAWRLIEVVWTCRRWRNTSRPTVGEMLDELKWSTPEAQRYQSSLLFFLDKDKYLIRHLPGPGITMPP